MLRTTRTRQLVVETFLDLLDEGEPQPTAQMVSDRSGVSMRSIFRIFADVDAMHSASIATVIDRVTHLLIDLDPSGPIEARTKRLVDNRAKFYEAITPVRRMEVRLAPNSKPIQADLKLANAFFRAQVADLFTSELAATAAPRRADLLDALDMTTSWETWDRLRGIQHVPERRARRIVSDMVNQALTTE